MDIADSSSEDWGAVWAESQVEMVEVVRVAFPGVILIIAGLHI